MSKTNIIWWFSLMLVTKEQRYWNRWLKFPTRALPCNAKTCAAYSGIKFSSKFQLKDQTKRDHQHDVVYYEKCLEEQCTEDYTGETGRRLIERVKDHSGKDSKSHLFKHSMEANHETLTLDDFKTKGKG